MFYHVKSLDVSKTEIYASKLIMSPSSHREFCNQEKLFKEYANFRFHQPYQQALYYCSLILEHKKWDINAYIEAINPIETADLISFFPRMLSRLHFECYVAGKLCKTCVLDIHNFFS